MEINISTEQPNINTEPVIIPEKRKKGRPKITPEQRANGIRGGHPYNDSCNCGRCKQIKKGYEIQKKYKEKIIADYISNNPENSKQVKIELNENEHLFVLHESTFELLMTKLNKLKDLYPNSKFSFNDFLNSILTSFLKKL